MKIKVFCLLLTGLLISTQLNALVRDPGYCPDANIIIRLVEDANTLSFLPSSDSSEYTLLFTSNFYTWSYYKWTFVLGPFGDKPPPVDDSTDPDDETSPDDNLPQATQLSLNQQALQTVKTLSGTPETIADKRADEWVCVYNVDSGHSAMAVYPALH